MATPVVYPQLKTAHNAQYADEQGAITVAEGSVNCAAAAGASLANLYPQAKLVTHHAFRLKAGDPKTSSGAPAGLGSLGVTAALKALGVPAIRHYGESYTVARSALVDGHIVQAAVDYGVVNDDYPQLSGQKTFRGGHAWIVYGWTSADPRLGGKNSVMVAEGLYDGRTKTWGTAPEGPQLAPFGAVRAAMGAFRVGGSTYATGKPIGKDLGIFVVVASPIVEPTPPMPTPDPCADLQLQIDELTKRLAAKDASFDAIILEASKGKGA